MPTSFESLKPLSGLGLGPIELGGNTQGWHRADGHTLGAPSVLRCDLNAGMGVIQITFFLFFGKNPDCGHRSVCLRSLKKWNYGGLYLLSVKIQCCATMQCCTTLHLTQVHRAISIPLELLNVSFVVFLQHAL